MNPLFTISVLAAGVVGAALAGVVPTAFLHGYEVAFSGHLTLGENASHAFSVPEGTGHVFIEPHTGHGGGFTIEVGPERAVEFRIEEATPRPWWTGIDPATERWSVEVMTTGV